MLLLHWKTALGAVLCAAAYYQPGPAQVAPPAILQVDVENYVQYAEDISDPSKFATDSNFTRANLPKNFYQQVSIGDVVAVNGGPAKGTVVLRSTRVTLTTDPNPG